jgi:hypothetical protein
MVLFVAFYLVFCKVVLDKFASIGAAAQWMVAGHCGYSRKWSVTLRTWTVSARYRKTKGRCPIHKRKISPYFSAHCDNSRKKSEIKEVTYKYFTRVNVMPKRMLEGRLYSKRWKGRPRMRWLEEVENDLKKL